MIRIEEYQDSAQRSPFGAWFDGLDSTAAAIITVALTRLADGNTSRVEPIGEGAAEIKIDRGPGYRIYFGWDGKTLVILLGGGTKQRQQRDIDAALACWRDYKARKAALVAGPDTTKKKKKNK
ncbi:type II toxin-antitoxin system RelE/ParE family toxin [Caulobacter segnis]|uniref:type II toxin-antitoxin system RelE/ParE family toxin n=1 Tax=Caulobacter segnis TaxID=88688 RepID=UPI0026B488C0|nr:type II toxin-antitoxin system RelE/ParE family toxin [Caulobacter segnis]